MKRAWLAVGFVVAVVAVGVTADRDRSSPPELPACPGGFAHLRGTGCARSLGQGMYEVALRSGERVTTHGPDSVEALADEGPGRGPQRVAQTSTDAPHQCVESTEAHHRIIYAYPSDRASRYDALSSTIRGNVDKLQFTVNDEATRLGSSAKLKFLCASTTGLERVTVVQTAVTAANTTFSSLLSDLKAKGYDSTLGKYLIYSDVMAAGSTACGQGTLTTDDRAVEDNANNIGPEYAVLWDCNVSFAHEWGHTHGAVQPGAPHFYANTGGRHCYDERSVMCYGNSDTDSTIQQLCPDRNWFDCNNDDYFHTAPASGSYLATNWNIGLCANKWVVYTACAALPPPPTTTSTATTTTTAVATTTPTKPGAPANVGATRDVSRKLATVTWQVPSTGGAPSGYYLHECSYLNTVLTVCEPARVLPGMTSSPTQRSTDPTLGYCWAMSAYNTAGEGPRTSKTCYW